MSTKKTVPNTLPTRTRKTNFPKEVSNKVSSNAAVIYDEDSFEITYLGFLNRVLVQVNLPHSNPGDDLEVWTRSNGNLHLSIQPKKFIDKGKLRCIGYPFGNLPRLLLIYLCTEAVKNRSPEIFLGNSLSEFMNSLGIEATGGRYGSIARFKEQLRRLLTAHIHFTYENEEIAVDGNVNIARKTILWWDEDSPKHGRSFASSVLLSEHFFEEIIDHPVPVDMRAIDALKQSSLALDLYTWLTHRVTYLKRSQYITWEALSKQVGSDYSEVKDFKRRAREELLKIKSLWYDLHLEETPGGFMLKPGRPHIKSTSVYLFVKDTDSGFPLFEDE